MAASGQPQRAVETGRGKRQCPIVGRRVAPLGRLTATKIRDTVQTSTVVRECTLRARVGDPRKTSASNGWEA